MHTSSTQMADPLLRCEDDKLILRCKNDKHWVGALLVGFGLFAICAIISTGLAPWFIVLISLTVGMPFLAIGGYFLLLYTIVTIFDLRSRQVTRSISIGRDWYQRSRAYYFADIAGIGFKAFSIDQSVTLAMMGSYSVIPAQYTYMPAVKARNGRIRWLAIPSCNPWTRKADLKYGRYKEALAAVCAATSLQKLQFPNASW
jgi:hypothetical protein